MNISKINYNFNRFAKPAFKSNIIFDIGGSQKEGSCKIYYSTSNTDERIFSTQTTVNETGKTQFKSSDYFIERLVKKVKKIQDNNTSNVQDMGYDSSENIIKSMTIFVPSYTNDRFAYYLPNHRNLDDLPLTNINFSTIKEKLINSGVKIDPKMKFTLLQDAMGAGLAVTKKLFDEGMLSRGKYYTACITGGGCGVANIEMTDDKSVIIKSTGSGYLPSSDQLEKVSKVGASAPALICNFCRAFAINPDMIMAIKGCHKAEFTLNNPVTYLKDVKTEKLKRLLLATDKYEIKEENNTYYTLRVKKEYEEDYNLARKSAIDDYCNAFARLAIIKKNEASNGLIITGPLAKAINTIAKKYYNTDISKMITARLTSKFNTEELNKTQKTYDFKVICDSRFFIDDNTACHYLAHNIEFVAPNRYNWIKIGVKDLQNPPEAKHKSVEISSN